MPPFAIALIAGIAMVAGLFGGTVMALSKLHLPPPPPPPKAPLLVKETVSSTPKTLEDFSKVASELDSWRRELTEKNNKALLLDSELVRREQLIQAERVALDKERARLDEVLKNIENRLIKIKTNEGAQLQQIVDLYGKMKPEAAVTLLQSLPEEQATKVVAKIDDPKLKAKLIETWLSLARTPADKEKIARITTNLLRTIDEPSDASTSSTQPSP